MSYGTGTLPYEDGWIPLVVGLGLWSCLGLVAGVVLGILAAGGTLAPGTAARIGSLALLGAPVALFTARGSEAVAEASVPWLAALRWGLPLLLVAMSVASVLARKSLVREPGGLSGFVPGALLGQGATAFALGLRTVESARLWARPPGRLGLLVVFLVFALLLSWGAARWQRRGTAAVAAAGVLLAALFSTATAMAWGTRALVRKRTGEMVSEGRQGPDVLLIVLDTVRADHLSAYGYARKTTPELEVLRDRSVVFGSAYASSPYTLSSHASLFTGLAPSAHGAHPVPMGPPGSTLPEDGPDLALYERPLSEAAVTLAEELSSRGYRTAGIVANNAYLSEWSGLSQGFEYYDCRISRLYRYPPVFLPLARRLGGAILGRVSPELTLRADEVTDRAMAWLAHGPGGPLLLFLNYLDAHDPHEAPAGYDRLFGSPTGSFDWAAVEQRLLEGKDGLTAEERDHFTAQYDGEIAFVDAQVGRLLRALDRAGQLDAMLVIVTADHGEYLGEHGRVGHANGLHEEALHVPLIVKLPGQRERFDVREDVTLQDVPRLIARVREGTLKPGDIPSLLRSGEPRVVSEFWFSDADRELDPHRFSSPVVRAVLQRPWKLIESLTGENELYDLDTDPREQNNLFGSDPIQARRVSARMLATLESLESIRGEPRRGPADPQILEKLRSLGYLQ